MRPIVFRHRLRPGNIVSDYWTEFDLRHR
jgi:hypothetical protein